MELVYLWVEEYKNIKKQGFDFSPRFECEYDEEKNELTVDEKKDYVSIFPDNINVTAIVGENGSGKSTILKLLENSNELNAVTKFIIYEQEKKYYCLYNNVKPEIVFSKDILSIPFSDWINKPYYYDPKIVRVAYNEKIGKDGFALYRFGNYAPLSEGWDSDRKDFYNILESRFFIPRYINIMLDFPDLFKKLKSLYKFDTLRLLLNHNSISYVRKWIDTEKRDFKDQCNSEHTKVCIYEKNQRVMDLIQKECKRPIDEIEINIYNRDRKKIVNIVEEIERLHRSQTSNRRTDEFNKHQEFDLGILIAFVEYYLKHTKPCESVEAIKDVLSVLEKKIQEDILKHKSVRRIYNSYILDFFQDLKAKNFIFKEKGLLSVDDIINAIKYFQTFKEPDFDKDGNLYIDIPIKTLSKENLQHIKIMQKIFFEHEFDAGNEDFLRVFEYNLFNSKNNSSYDSISDGEKQLMKFLIDILYFLKGLQKFNVPLYQEKLALFLADEPDNAMHPLWKKKLIANVMDIFQYVHISNIKFHFIYSSHSPFLLSDLPKENVIFLQRDENGNCNNVTKETDINPFGANIHTLLSHGFFMKDGLMGEFAKTKIQEVMDFLNNKKTIEKLSIEEKHIKPIIESIGEPFLKNKLLKMYEERYPKSTEQQIQELEAKIKSLKNA